MRTFIVDTNIPKVASGRNTTASLQCQTICIETLEDLVNSHRVAIDDKELILNEYQRHLNLRGEPSVGDFFYKHVFDNQYNSNKVERVSITKLDNYGNFKEFPNNDIRLERFDLSDRKFVAVALKSQKKSEILNAIDSDWINFSNALKDYVNIRQLC